MVSTPPGHVLVPGDELTEDEMVGLISNEEGAHQSEVVPQLVNSEVDYATIPIEVLEAAGIDIENMAELSEEQVSTLLALAGPNSGLVAVPQQPHARMAEKREASPLTQPDPADNLTMVISEDGSLKLTDSAQQNFFFSAEQLAAHNIDVNNLTDESIQQIVQMAMPSLDMGKSAEQKRRKLEALPPAASAQLPYETLMPSAGLLEPVLQPSTSVAAKIPLSVPVDHRSDQLALIGEEVEVKKNGKLVPATIRYCRNSGGYKVQFTDGHFEWVTEDQIQVRGLKSRSDHESYSGTSSDMEVMRSNTLGSSGIGRRVPPAIPGIKVTPSNGFEKEEPNFCCVICDRKVYQKDPQYIVIRVPACDACTELKIMVLDTATEERSAQASPSALEAPEPVYGADQRPSEELTNVARTPDDLVDIPPALERSVVDDVEDGVVSSSEQNENPSAPEERIGISAASER